MGQLCDGKSRAPDDEVVFKVSQSLRGTESSAVLRRATWLQLDLKGKGEKPVRTIVSVVRSLGGISEDKKVGPLGGKNVYTAGSYQVITEKTGIQ